MEISYPQYVDDHAGYPFLLVHLNGRPTWIFYEQKFLDQDIVILPDREAADDPITVPADPKRGRNEITLDCAVRNKRLAKLVRRYCEDVNKPGGFHPGPVEWDPDDD